MKFFVLSNDRGGFYINTFQAKDRDKANEIFEEEMATNMGCEWLLDEDSFESLKRCLNENK